MIEKILDYQNIENELISAENELSKSKDREKAVAIQQAMKNQHSRLVTLEESAKHVNAVYKKAMDKYQEYLKKLEELEKQVEAADESKIALYEKAYKDFSAVATSLEKEISNIYADVQSISKEYEDIMKKSKSDRENFDKYRAAYNKLKAQKEPQIAELKEKLVSTAKAIESKLMSLYKQKRENNLFPVFVELQASKCSGCRMEVSASKLTKMKTNDYGIIECENCGRYIYKK